MRKAGKMSIKVSETVWPPGDAVRKANVWRLWLLRPLSLLYGLGVWWRNQFFDRGFLPQTSYPVPVLCVGNLEAGGSGKTPMTDWLISHFYSQYTIAYLSRGYKRISAGPVVAEDKSTPAELGDEAFLLFKKW